MKKIASVLIIIFVGIFLAISLLWSQYYLIARGKWQVPAVSAPVQEK